MLEAARLESWRVWNCSFGT